MPTENTLLFNTKKDISVWATYMNYMLDKKSNCKDLIKGNKRPAIPA